MTDPATPEPLPDADWELLDALGLPREITPQPHPFLEALQSNDDERFPDKVQALEVLEKAAKQILSDDFRRRLQRTEHEVSVMTQMEREATVDWLGAMLHRPPLEKPHRTWVPVRALVEALWWDIADRTPADATDPDAGNERLVPNHPWGEGSEA